MAEKRITLLGADESQRPYMLTHFAKNDRYRVGQKTFPGEESWTHGYEVDAVYKQAGIFDAGFAVGDTLHAYNASNKYLGSFRVTKIEMINLDEFDFGRMGYVDNLAFVQAHPLFDVKRCWLVHKEIVDATPR